MTGFDLKKTVLLNKLDALDGVDNHIDLRLAEPYLQNALGNAVGGDPYYFEYLLNAGIKCKSENARAHSVTMDTLSGAQYPYMDCDQFDKEAQEVERSHHLPVLQRANSLPNNLLRIIGR